MATIRQTCAAWVKNTGKHMSAAKGNVYYQKSSRTIYSYGTHFPIARIITLPSGEDIALFTRQDYSISTGNHKRHARNALGDMPIVLVSNPTVEPSVGEITKSLALAAEAEARAKRARAEWSRKCHLEVADREEGNAHRIATLFHLNP